MAQTLIGGLRLEASVATRPLASVTLVIENMQCGGCLRKAETALANVPGVAHARANLSTHRAQVSFPEGTVETERLVAALADAGFKAAELVTSDASALSDADKDFLRRLAVAGFAAANVMLLSVSVWSGAQGDMSPAQQTLFHWLSALIALPATAYAGQPFFRSALAALRSGRVNMDVPISLGVTLATGMSVYQTMRGSEQVYFDAAVTLLFFLLVGRALDQRMRVRSAGAAANLLGLRAQSALVVDRDGSSRRVAARHLIPGMRFLVAAGERLAADARIAEGAGEIDESLLTGETRPRRVAPGDTVYAGTINLGQPLTLETTAADERTLIAEIARLMTAAEQGRASYVRLADRAARLYAPSVHILSLATFLGWLTFGFGWEPALTAAIAVLIITCPCALALAVPAVQVAATSRLFSKGILVKAPDALERIAEIDTVVLDKTGTLTRGEPALADPQRIDDVTLVRIAGMASVSRHPYARAVVRAARARGLSIDSGHGVTETAGAGLERITGPRVERLGSAAWCGAAGTDGVSLWYRDAGAAPLPLAVTDEIRTDAHSVVAVLASAGLATELASGDQPREVGRVADAAGIQVWSAGLRPADKLALLAALARRGKRVLMVGDGLNDAPALAAAHASLSPSTAADISQTAADAVFQGDALAPVVETIAVARVSRRMAVENFLIAIGYNACFVPLAMLGYVTPLVAAVAMSASSIAVTLNAVRLKRKTLVLGNRRLGP